MPMLVGLEWLNEALAIVRGDDFARSGNVK